MPKRDRKPNFTEAELSLLLHEILNHKGILMSTLTGGITLAKKKAIWQEIANKLSSLGVAERTVEDIKKKWQDTKSVVTAAIRDQRKNSREPVKPLPVFSEVILQIIGSESRTTRIQSQASATGLQIKHSGSPVQQDRVMLSLAHDGDPHTRLAAYDDPSSSNSNASLLAKIEEPDSPLTDPISIVDPFQESDSEMFVPNSLRSRKKGSKNENDSDDVYKEWLISQTRLNRLKESLVIEYTEVMKLKKRKLEIEIAKAEKELNP